MAKTKPKAKRQKSSANKPPPKERLKPMTLAPLSFDEAMRKIIKAKP